ncbi:MAG: hypothetical protein LBS68_02565 [Puniceicoccales bacterium]|nr:hypothetical protein [Puniceicoccales bacterium]
MTPIRIMASINANPENARNTCAGIEDRDALRFLQFLCKFFCNENMQRLLSSDLSYGIYQRIINIINSPQLSLQNRAADAGNQCWLLFELMVRQTLQRHGELSSDLSLRQNCQSSLALLRELRPNPPHEIVNNGNIPQGSSIPWREISTTSSSETVSTDSSLCLPVGNVGDCADEEENETETLTA